MGVWQDKYANGHFNSLLEPYEVFSLPSYLPAKRELEGREKYIWNMAKRHLHPKDSHRSLCWGPRVHCGLRGISLAQGLYTLTSLSLRFTEKAHELCFLSAGSTSLLLQGLEHLSVGAQQPQFSLAPCCLGTCSSKLLDKLELVT